MKRFLFAVAVVALVSGVSVAEEKPVAPAPATPAAPVIVSGTPITEATPATTTQRRGLFSRLRNRNNAPSMPTTTTTTAPTTTITPAPTPMPPITPTPMPPKPMPNTKPANTQATPGTIILTSGTTTGEVNTANSSEPTTQRRGFMSRLRNR